MFESYKGLTPFSYVVIFGASVTNLAMGILDPTISIYLKLLGSSYQEVGSILAARFLIVAILSFPLALFATRLGLSKIVGFSGLSALIAGPMIMFNQTQQGVYNFYLIAGISQAAMSGPGAAILAQNKGNSRITAFALFSTTWMIPPAIGAGISAFWFYNTSSYSSQNLSSIFFPVFVVLTTGGLLFFVLFFVQIRKETKEDMDSQVNFKAQVKILYTSAAVVPFILFTLVNLMSGAGAGATLPYLPPFLKSLGAQPAQISVLVLILNLAMGIATQTTPFLTRKFNPTKVYLVTSMLSVFSLIGLVISTNLITASIFYILRGMFANMSSPIVQASFLSYIEEKIRATGGAWLSTFRWVGWTVFSPVSGNLIDLYGYIESFLITSTLYIISTLLFVFTVTRFRSVDDSIPTDEFTEEFEESISLG